MKIAAFLGSIYGGYLRSAYKSLDLGDVDLTAFSGRKALADLEKAAKAVREADLLFIHDAGEGVADSLKSELENWPSDKPYLKLGHDGADWGGNVDPELLARANQYLVEGGPANGQNFWRFLKALAEKEPEKAPPPETLPRFGFWHPKAPKVYYGALAEFLDWLRPYAKAHGLGPAVGLLVNRFFWAIARPDIEAETILALEREGLMVLPAFASWADGPGETGAIPFALENFGGANGPKVEAIVKFISHFSNEGQDVKPTFVGDDSPARANVRLFRELGAPVFQPLCSWGQSNAQWQANPRGLGLEAAWTITMTEFEGVIEPFYVGGSEKDPEGAEETRRTAHQERARRLAKRVANWVRLRRTPPAERKVAFILHNSPCASVEATVGTALGLDSAESLAKAAQAMKAAGYQIEPPASGAELMEAILAKKALSDFRWTPVEAIVGAGGALALLDLPAYEKWHRDFPESVKTSLKAAWGDPPGEAIDEVPPAMVHEGQIVVSGLSLGPNALVAVQPKRGCAGARCDGRVCRILQDPLIPPPHQYLAVYRWLADPAGFGAHAVVHVGTHGSLEFLPGKSAALSEECLPDLALHELPNLYIFAAGATGDGLTAKRRSYAALIDHLPPIGAGTELYGAFAEVGDLLGQRARTQDQGRRALLEGLIREKAPAIGLSGPLVDGDFEELAYEARKILALLADSQTEEGLHVFGDSPQKERLAKLAALILRYEGGEALSFRAYLAQELGLCFAACQSDPGLVDPLSGAGAAELTLRLDQAVREILAKAVDLESRLATAKSLMRADRPAGVAGQEEGKGEGQGNGQGDGQGEGNGQGDGQGERNVEGQGNGQGEGQGDFGAIFSAEFIGLVGQFLGRPPADPAYLAALATRVADILARARASREIPALLEGLSGRYVLPGPSASIWRGRADVLPTGRNFYTQDPRRLPTPAATKVGAALAEETAAKHFKEEGRWPESVAFFWISSDLLQNDGEDLAQMLALMGLKPKWAASGALTGTEVVPLAELGRPRIDLIVRISGIMRDSFGGTVDQLDRAILKVASLDEPVEANFVRAHSLENLKSQKTDPGSPLAFRRAAYRIFASPPGSCVSGVYLAVMASAWRDEGDLAEVYLRHGSYAYGEGVFGELAPGAFKAALSRVDVSYVKLNADSDDFLGCGGYFGEQGGLAVAAESLTGRKIRHYCGDARNPKALKTRTLAEEISRSAASRLLCPAWIEGQKRHGYKGAQEIAKRVGNAYGWQATAKAVDPAIFDGVAKTFFLDEE
ncbi:MAG: cobaltochelatase subunit CobN, partial [Deltaproteobacteria bacterium]|nr:cobaltochelatase subunit CobN [Deltaproteobacteria bacterium]